MSGTCSVRTENAGTSISISRPKASRAETFVSGTLISEVGRGGEMSTAVFIVQRFLLQFRESLALAAHGARAAVVRSGSELSCGGDPGFRTKPCADSCIGKVDGLQALLGITATAVGIGVVSFSQFLVAAFHRIEGSGPRQA